MGLYQWVGPGTDIGDGDNWRNEIAGTTGTEPTVDDDVVMFTAGTFTGQVDVDSISLQSQGTGTITFDKGADVESEGATATTVTGNVTFNDAFIEPNGLTVEATSTLRLLNGASFDQEYGNDSDLTIGSAMGTATLLVDNSSVYTQLNAGTLTIGSGSSSVGLLTVQNGAGYDTAASLTLLGGGDAQSAGRVLITGATTNAIFDGRVEIGGGGTGTFTVAGGAYASLGLHDNVAVGSLNATGTITATGAGSLLSVAGNLEFGAYQGVSSGLGTVAQGATLAVAGDILVYAGSLSVSGAGSMLSGRLYLPQIATDQLSITAGATARFIDADVQAGSTITLQAGTLDARHRIVIATGKISGNGVANAQYVENDGTLTATGGTLQVIGAHSGAGTDVISKAATLELDGSVAAQLKIAFLTGASTLSLKDAPDMAAHIRGFGAGETIDLLGDPATTMSFANDILTIRNGATLDATLHFTGSYTAANFKLASDGHGGSQVTYVASGAAHPASAYTASTPDRLHVPDHLHVVL